MVHDFTIICIMGKLEVKMPRYTSLISYVHKSYRVEKLVLDHLIFSLVKMTKCLLVPNAILFHILLPYKSPIFAVVMKLCLEPIINTNLNE